LANQTNDKHRTREKQELSEKTPDFHASMRALRRASFSATDHRTSQKDTKNLRAFRPDGMQNPIMSRPINGGND
jgi:hypothetical protein